MKRHKIRKKYPNLIRLIRWTAILSQSEAVSVIRAWKEGQKWGPEAVMHYGGVERVLKDAVRNRNPQWQIILDAHRTPYWTVMIIHDSSGTVDYYYMDLRWERCNSILDLDADQVRNQDPNVFDKFDHLYHDGQDPDRSCVMGPFESEEKLTQAIKRKSNRGTLVHETKVGILY